MRISGRGKVTQNSQMAPVFILEVVLPVSIFDCMDPQGSPQVFLEGQLNITSASNALVTEPESLGYLHLPRDRPTRGARWKIKNTEYIVNSVGQNQLELSGGKSLFCRNLSGGRLIPTNYQVFNTRGVSFPVSDYTCPAGIGHTLILDPQRCKVRTLSVMECWKLQGGSPEDYPLESNVPETLERILGGTHWGLQLYMAGLAYGTFFSLYSLVDSPNVGSCEKLYCSSP